MEKSAQKPSCIFIGKMPPISQYPLLQIIWVFSHLKHADIVICFQEQGIQPLKMLHNIIIIFPKVCCNPYRTAVMLNPEANRLCCIMRDGKCIYFQILYLKRFILPDLLDQPLGQLAQPFRPADGICSTSRCVNGNLVLS